MRRKTQSRKYLFLRRSEVATLTMKLTKIRVLPLTVPSSKSQALLHSVPHCFPTLVCKHLKSTKEEKIASPLKDYWNCSWKMKKHDKACHIMTSATFLIPHIGRRKLPNILKQVYRFLVLFYLKHDQAMLWRGLFEGNHLCQ